MMHYYINKEHFVWEENYIIYLFFGLCQVPTKVIQCFLILTIIFMKN